MNTSKFFDRKKKVSKSLSTIISDRFLFCLILILGGIGTYYSINLIADSNFYKKHDITLGNKAFSESDLAKYSFTRPLSIDGDMKVGNSVSLSVDKQLKTEPLYVDFGNGDIEKLMEERKLEIHYALPGVYEIELFTVQDNQKMSLSNQQVIIESDYTQLSSSK